MRIPFTVSLLFLCATAVFGDQFVSEEEIEKYKEISARLKQQLAEKARQTVVDIEQVIKAEESTLECLGKMCKTNNIFIYYQCCQDIPGECCWHLRYWLT
ncbi:unnamed protein product [Toxocara canis]|uniref:HNTX-XVI.3 n=1 Tax=Toxocara canis TaxID=6265 RepID=A0A183TZK9_TOXCA|nr:unnamed protein product [Toxocara canis]